MIKFLLRPVVHPFTPKIPVVTLWSSTAIKVRMFSATLPSKACSLWTTCNMRRHAKMEITKENLNLTMRFSLLWHDCINSVRGKVSEVAKIFSCLVRIFGYWKWLHVLLWSKSQNFGSRSRFLTSIPSVKAVRFSSTLKFISWCPFLMAIIYVMDQIFYF